MKTITVYNSDVVTTFVGDEDTFHSDTWTEIKDRLATLGYRIELSDTNELSEILDYITGLEDS